MAYNAEMTVVDLIRTLLRRREEGSLDVTSTADLFDDLGLDSLEVAELSVMLEDELGSDPYSAGITPRTVSEIVEFYESVRS